MKSQKFISIFSVMFFVLTFVAFAQAQKEAVKNQDNEKKVKTSSVMKDVEGQVTWLGKDKIAIAYHQEGATEYEILLPFDKNGITTEHKKFNEIQKGDTVKVSYEEITEESLEQGKEKEEPKITFNAKTISFIKPNPQGAAALTSQESGSLSLKGVKGE